MGIHFVCGGAMSGKSDLLYRRIIEKASKDFNKKYIFVVPEQAALSAEKELIRLSGCGGILNIQVLSFTRLAYKILEEYNDNNRVMIDDLGKSMLIRRIMSENRASLKLYGRKESNIGFLDEIKSLISEFEQYMVRPEQLKEIAEKRAECGKEDYIYHKLHDLYEIYKNYKNRIDEYGFTTAETLPELAFGYIQTARTLDCELIFDGFTGFTPVQYEFVERLIIRGLSLNFTINCDSDFLSVYEAFSEGKFEDKYYLFGMSLRMVGKIRDYALKNGIILSDDDFEFVGKDSENFSENAIYKLKNRVFRSRSDADNDDTVKLSGLSGCVVLKNNLLNLRDEAEYIVSTIDYMIIKLGMKYSDFAIITPILDDYIPYFADLFEKYGIEYYIDKRFNIAGNPLIRFIDSALSAALSNLSFESVLEFVKSPFMFGGKTEVFEFENYIYSRNISKFSRYQKNWDTPYYGNNPVSLENVNKIRDSVAVKLTPFFKTKKPRTVKYYKEAIIKLLEDNDCRKKLAELKDGLSETGIRHAEYYASEYERVYDTVLLLLEQTEALLAGDLISLKEFYDVFMTGVSKLSLGILPRSNDCVILGDIKRTRVNNVTCLFMPGMINGIIPAASNEDGLLTADDRKMLETAGIELAGASDSDYYDSLYYVYMAVSKPYDKLYVTCPIKAGRQEILPSMIFDEIAGITDEELYDCEVHKACPDLLSVDLDGDELSLIENYSVHDGYENISKEVSEKLYGKLSGSVTRIETFAKCPFRYFANYGLVLGDRPDYRPQPVHLGTVRHAALKAFVDKIAEDLNSGKSKDDLSETQYSEYAAKFIDESFETEVNGIYREDNEIKSISDRVRRDFIDMAIYILNQYKNSEFVPVATEKSFTIPDILGGTALKGTIDRIDIAEKNGKCLVKVTDYKSSEQKIDSHELENGLRLQLPLYLKDVLDYDKVSENQDAAAAEYLSLKMSEIDMDADNAVCDRESLYKGIVNSGYYLNDLNYAGMFDKTFSPVDGVVPDGNSLYTKFTVKKGNVSTTAGSEVLSPDEMHIIADYAVNKIKELSNDIKDGKTEVSPTAGSLYDFTSGEDSFKISAYYGCKYCNYRNTCGFDLGRCMDKIRYIRVNTDNRKEPLNRILGRKEEKDG